MERSLHIIYSLFFIIASAISQMEIGGNRRLVNISQLLTRDLLVMIWEINFCLFNSAENDRRSMAG